MKLYINLVQAVSKAIVAIFVHNEQADHYIQKLFSENKKWGARDRHFVADTVYSIVRYYRYYCYLAGVDENFSNPEDAQKIVTAFFVAKAIPLPEWEIFSSAAIDTIQTRIDSEIPHAIRAAFPDWLYEKAQLQFGEKWQAIADELNIPANVSIRVNTNLITVEKLKKRLTDEGISFTDLGNNALRIDERKNLLQSELFKSGFFEIQDFHSQQIAWQIPVAECKLIIDCCAGAGGKSLQLATMQYGKGKIIAHDMATHKLDILKNRAMRNKLTNIETEKNTNTLLDKYAHKADAVLIDAPCSGLGVLKRNPDSKWKMTADKIEKIKYMQQQCLQDYATLVKDNGYLIYATCTIFSDENDQQIATFLAQNNNFILLKEKLLLPSVEGFDGFYYAVLKKNSTIL